MTPGPGPSGYSAGAAVAPLCKARDDQFNGTTANDVVWLLGMEFRYTAAQ